MKRPLIFFLISMCAGIITSIILKNFFFLGAAAAAFFCVLLYFCLKNRYFFICMMFFAIGYLSSGMYYGFNLKSNFLGNIRIVQVKKYYAIGKVYGRKVKIETYNKKIMDGEYIFSKGKAKNVPDYINGTIGTIYLKSVKENKSDILNKIYRYKDYVYSKLSKGIGLDNAALVMGVSFGDTKYISDFSRDEFNKFGVAYALSVAGFHVSLVFAFFEKFLGMYPAVLISLFYSIFTGFKPATMRALFMILFMKFSKKINKKYDSLNSLCLSAMVILVFYPYYILDIGFMLSYLAVLGIILYYKRLRKFFYFLPQKICTSISISISTQILTMPLAGAAFGNFSPGFLLGSMILMPVFSVVIIVSNLALIFLNIEKLSFIFYFILNFLMTVLCGAEYVLNFITPDVIDMSIQNCIAFAVLYISYLLVKRGYRKFIYTPIVLSVFLFCQYLNPFLEFRSLHYKGVRAVIINYMSDSVMAAEFHQKDISTVRKMIDIYNPEKVISCMNQKKIGINIGGRHVQITDDKGCKSTIERVKYNGYDIIKVVPCNLKNNETYILIFKKVFVLPDFWGNAK